MQIPFVTTQCGYCLGFLAAVERGQAINYECPRCQPELAAVVTIADYAAFQKRVAPKESRR